MAFLECTGVAREAKVCFVIPVQAGAPIQGDLLNSGGGAQGQRLEAACGGVVAPLQDVAK